MSGDSDDRILMTGTEGGVVSYFTRAPANFHLGFGTRSVARMGRWPNRAINEAARNIKDGLADHTALEPKLGSNKNPQKKNESISCEGR